MKVLIASLVSSVLSVPVMSQMVASLNVGGKGVGGSVKFTASGNNAVQILAQVTGLQGLDINNIYPWHIHVNAISGTDCASAGGHLNLLNVAETGTTCTEDPAQFATNCVTGNMAGKFGALSQAGSKSGIDHTFTLQDLVGRSVVVHTDDTAKTRLACGTITGNPGQTAAGKNATAVNNGGAKNGTAKGTATSPNPNAGAKAQNGAKASPAAQNNKAAASPAPKQNANVKASEAAQNVKASPAAKKTAAVKASPAAQKPAAANNGNGNAKPTPKVKRGRLVATFNGMNGIGGILFQASADKGTTTRIKAAVTCHFSKLGIDEDAVVCTEDAATFVTNYATGNLAGKFGMMSNAGSKTGIDHTFGLNDIRGLSVFIHKTDTAKARLACANIMDEPTAVPFGNGDTNLSPAFGSPKPSPSFGNGRAASPNFKALASPTPSMNNNGYQPKRSPYPSNGDYSVFWQQQGCITYSFKPCKGIIKVFTCDLTSESFSNAEKE
ncbi:hypothetical protein SmJEL517_g04870 [Synchytrium microbalum]|uniref:Superoxide dismutase copper/zinc binding domain-containing protein n=1 Tax=Synchytrium microbalum TaxID=1806994 RepID=A0A507BWU9_9FUNG|nr:uncharacterized protein SmJEL517_g04870 [Synchytrium microbalum]TPX31922.1 hypothetical protein SmJEL517_g04870 [Synchytrium microbalum]